VICFILSSRHHAFSNAAQVTSAISGAIGSNAEFAPVVEAWLSIAEAELGVESALRALLRAGIAVHTSALVSSEHAASEWMFKKEKAKLMFATGTLAQGLNLPAIAVVIAGTSMGDARDVRDIDRINALILNGFGRAGRPGFSNQGLAVLVSDTPYRAPIVHELDPSRALYDYEVLGRADATIHVRSPFNQFLDRLFAGDLGREPNEQELMIISLLAEHQTEDQNAGSILARTLGAHQGSRIMSHDTVNSVREYINDLKDYFVEQQLETPFWINTAAMKAGVSLIRASQIWRAYQHCGVVSLEEAEFLDVRDWFGIFMRVMSNLPPKRIAEYLSPMEQQRRTVLTRMRDALHGRLALDSIPWPMPVAWRSLWEEFEELVLLYMRGAPLAAIAQKYLNLEAHEISNKRSDGRHPIPAVLKFLRDIVDPLSIDAGCFLAINEAILAGAHQESSTLPESLQALPLCIRNGCDSLGTLTWYRVGYRERIAAHEFEKNFPVPSDLTVEHERVAWVLETRRRWISGEILPADDNVLQHVRVVMTDS
jgi:hypothetical protein